MTQPHATESPGTGIEVQSLFAGPKHEGDPFAAVAWERRRAELRDEKDKVVWAQDAVEVPQGWSQLAIDVVASKYLYGNPANTLPDGRPERESSVRQLVHRVTAPIAAQGLKDGTFAGEGDADAFRRELVALTLGQYAAFNSPVWFNMGLSHVYGIRGAANNWIWDDDAGKAVPCPDAYAHPQGSACFIQAVDDDMVSIMALAASEAMLFKYGSGTGSDLSTLRSSREHVNGGGKASGPVSFMRIYDAVASVVKSGGKTRRAAKMQTLKCWHPDILEFIECKAGEEKKARTLIRAGYEANFNGEAYSSVLFQNANLSVRATDEFLRKAAGIRPAPGPADRDWPTVAVTTGSPAGMPAYNAAQLLDKIAEGTWACGDPGMQYEDTIQGWHTCPNTAPINSSNPCSEYMFIDDTSCNLASLNLLKFRRDDGTIDDFRLRAAARRMIIGQEILVDMGSYPTAKIAENSHNFRPLGLGYCNLGSLIMAQGKPYDSDEGRALAALVTALLHGAAYLTSAELAATKGPYPGFAANREPMLRVIRRHRAAVDDIAAHGDPELERLKAVARGLWADVEALGAEHGFRNSQVTCIAPTGTIAFMMDADTTGIEPDVALVKYKQLAGRGQLKIVNQTVPLALKTLGYPADAAGRIVRYLDEHDTVEGCPDLAPGHLPVFDCAFAPARGVRAIDWRAHVKMMAAAQPFISGAISKTVNMPAEATVDDIRAAYLLGWRSGLKALAIYRNGSKESQPVTTTSAAGPVARALPWIDTEEGRAFLAVTGRLSARLGREPEPAEVEGLVAEALAAAQAAGQPMRHKLPRSRRAETHRFEIRSETAGTIEGYLTVGFYPGTRQPGELFITVSKAGSTVNGLMDVVATLASLGLQYGVPLEVFVRKFAHVQFEPRGLTDNPDIPVAKSIADYIFQWLGMEFIPGYREENSPRFRGLPADRVRGVRADLVDPAALDPEPADFPDRATFDRVLNGFHDPVIGAALSGLVGTPRTQPNEFERAWAAAAAPRGGAATAQLTGPPCPRCGAILIPAGPCFRCFSCGNDVGGCG